MAERRRGNRIEFERGIEVYMMAIDGTWRRSCVMDNVSETGVMLAIEGSIAQLNIKEFFLVLSSTGLAFRRCELAWVNGNHVGAKFLSKTDRPKEGRNRGKAPREPEAAPS